ncbi:MAG: aminopeptidase P family protein, partial [Deltaproteobacteria bacterium]|nr:aminopeptidase P family protein [Deltaproteobacteria bacterium]
ESALLLVVDGEGVRATLFVRLRNPGRETWDGPRAGVEGVVRDFGVDEGRPMDELEEGLADACGSSPCLWHRFGLAAAHDALVCRALDRLRAKPRSGLLPPSRMGCPAALLSELRLSKSSWELERMGAAIEITREAHLAAMRAARPGRFEYEVEAEMLRVFRAGGAERVAYDSILGSGPNATILHYRKNARRMQEGELLLIDAGAELDYYAADVTRTFPISGRFTEPQRRLYELVLDAQLAAIESVRPGATLPQIHDVAAGVITAGLVELGLLQGEPEALMEEGAHKRFYMHRTSHWLGMDVHDVGAYTVAGAARPIEPGFVLTVEPGIYVAPDAEAPEEYRGLGVRIEDDLLVTPDGARNLTREIPKQVAELERLLAQRTP